MTKLTFAPSPLAVVKAASSVVRRDGFRLALTTLVFFLAPYLAAYYGLYKPDVDGDYGNPTGYYVRYYAFILCFFALKGLNACLSGQIVYNRLTNEPRPLYAVLPDGLVNWARTLAIYVPVAALIYLGNFFYIAPGLIVGYFALFFLGAVLYDRLGLKGGWLKGARTRNGHNLILVFNYALLSGLLALVQAGIAPLSSLVTQHVSADAATVATAAVYAIIEFLSTLFAVTLFVLPQDHETPSTDVADLF